ncbi:hypothetical protein [Actinomadura parmotrematis]|uniref:Uncharacterized protein n=1 Tax=Actinomadura parmotrematis TaxID=2864039 RepID=A0ABS7FWV7_9ACTN|nr:hypothetical protein [Actinomadura parmotrematis]MBW8484909.1 hypothetical protein [Actinomadura parmotrematis]
MPETTGSGLVGPIAGWKAGLPAAVGRAAAKATAKQSPLQRPRPLLDEMSTLVRR